MARSRKPGRKLKIVRFLLISGVTIVAAGSVYGIHKLQMQRHAGGFALRAREAAKAEDWPLAASMFRNYLKFQPNDADVLREFVHALEKLQLQAPGKIYETIEVYERLRAIDALTPEDRRKLTFHYAKIENIEATRSTLEGLYGVQPEAKEDIELLELAATLQEKERKFSDAVASYRQIIATGQATPMAYIRLANLLRKEMNAEAEADSVVVDLVRARPNDLKARVVRADYRLRLGQVRAAKEDLEFAYRNIPGGDADLDVIQSLSALYTGEKNITAAQEVLSKALAKLPDEVRLYISLADIQIQARDAEGAKESLGKALKVHNKMDRLLLDIADRLVDLGEQEQVQAIGQKFNEAEVSYVHDYLQGRLKLKAGQWPTAIELLEKAVETGLERFPVYELSAYVYLSDAYGVAGNTTERLRYANRALKIDPRSPRALLTKAECLHAQGQTEQAMLIYRDLAIDSLAARAARCQMILNQILSQPPALRNWKQLEESYGAPPYSPEIEIIRATALIQQNRFNDGVKLLESTIAKLENQALPAPRIALAFALASRNLDDGLAVLDASEKTIGKKIEFLLARASLLARKQPPDQTRLLALADNASSMSAAERFQLFSKLGAIFTALDNSQQAIQFYRLACAENPRDPIVRLNCFEQALKGNDVELQAIILSELDAIEGPQGTTRLIAEVSRDLRKVQPTDAETINAIRARLTQIGKIRENWGPLFVLKADLELIAGNLDRALEQYRLAVKYGEESVGVIRNLVQLLLQRQGQQEATELLARLARRTTLPEDLNRQLLLLQSAFGDDATQSLAWARSEAAQNSNNPRDHLIRATVFETNRAITEARQAIEKALSYDDQSPELWATLIRLLVQENRNNDARNLIAQMQKKAEHDHNNPTALAQWELVRGASWELLGELSHANEAYSQSIKNDPTNVNIVAQVQRFYLRNGRKSDAEQLLNQLMFASEAAPEARRWARRMIALNLVSQGPNPNDVNRALKLIEQNLQEGNQALEDRRANALIVALDPFRQADAIKLLLDTTELSPLTATEQYYLSRMYQQQGRFDLAEEALRSATKLFTTVQPEHLAALARLQLRRSDTTAATKTIQQLKAIAGSTWEAYCEEARLLVAVNKQAEALEKLLSWKGNSDQTFVLSRTAPFLEEIGLVEAAGKIYRTAANDSKPLAHLPLATFLLRQGQAEEVVQLAFQHEASSPVGLTARLLAGAARVKPLALTPEAERQTWANTMQRIDGWIAKQLPLHPNNPEVLFAKAELDDLNARYDDELATYEQILKLDSTNPTYLNNYALLVALHLRDGGPKAFESIQQAIQIAGPTAAFLDTRAIVHLAGERFQDALNDLNAAIGMNPKPAYFFHLAIYEERKAGEKGPTSKRDAAFREAKRRGLQKQMLHPKEWADYDRLNEGSR